MQNLPVWQKYPLWQKVVELRTETRNTDITHWQQDNVFSLTWWI